LKIPTWLLDAKFASDKAYKCADIKLDQIIREKNGCITDSPNYKDYKVLVCEAELAAKVYFELCNKWESMTLKEQMNELYASGRSD